MKKAKGLGISILALSACACMVGALAACNDHTHVYSDAWTTSETEHWHAATCGHDSERKDKAAHDYEEVVTEANCEEKGYTTFTCKVCGYEYVGAYTEFGGHIFSTRLTSNATHHWYAALCSHTSEVNGYEPHNFVFDPESGMVCEDCEYIKEFATEGLAFTELSDGTYSVKKGDANSECVVIPSTYKNQPVTEIGSMAFQNVKWLKYVVIPSTVTKINGSAFYGSTLEEIYIPDSVKSIGASCFKNCANLVTVSLPSGMESVTTDAFANCTALQFNEAGNALYLGNAEIPYIALIKAKDTSITECDIQNGCELIYDQAFNNCAALETVTFPATLRIIGGRTFTGCKSLTDLVIPSNVESIGGQAFGGCSGLTSITVPFIGGGKQAGSNIYAFGYIFGASSYTGGIRTSQPAPSGSTSFYYVPENLETVTVTGNSIPNGAFKNCSMITTIKLSANIKAIPANAFDACYALTDVYFDGTQEQWNKVSVSSTGNAPFTAATVHCKEN